MFRFYFSRGLRGSMRWYVLMLTEAYVPAEADALYAEVAEGETLRCVPLRNATALAGEAKLDSSLKTGRNRPNRVLFCFHQTSGK